MKKYKSVVTVLQLKAIQIYFTFFIKTEKLYEKYAFHGINSFLKEFMHLIQNTSVLIPATCAQTIEHLRIKLEKQHQCFPDSGIMGIFNLSILNKHI